MKKASVGEAQHHLSRILKYVDQGEEVLLTRRNQVVARIVPPRNDNPELPDFTRRAREIFKEGNGVPLSEVVESDRDERS